MLPILRALYTEPVLFAGVLSTISAGLVQEGVIGWPGVVAVAALALITRRFTTNAKPGPSDLG